LIFANVQNARIAFDRTPNIKSTNIPPIHPGKNEKGTDDVNQPFHTAILNPNSSVVINR